MFTLVHQPMQRIAAIVVALTLLVALVGTPALAATTFLSGTVFADGKPVPAAVVSLTGNNLTLRTQTDPKGKFAFNALSVGSYDLAIDSRSGTTQLRVDLSTSGANLDIAVQKEIKTIGRTNATGHAIVRGGGTDVTLNTQTLSRSPASGNFPELLLQLPGAARGANGAVHINGDHGDINYVVDGVSLPQALNRVIGSEVDPSNLAFAEVLEGAYPAQYGEKFGSVLNLSTRSGSGAPGFSVDATGGSYAKYDGTLAYHAPVGQGSLSLAVRSERDGRALDPPNQNSPHAAGSDANQFIRLTLPHGTTDFVNFTLTHSLQTYQIPPDVLAGAPPAQNDNERQDDLFGSLQFRHAIGDHGAISFGPSIKRSHIQDLPDYANDIAAGIATTGVNDCSVDVTTCSYSVLADRTSLDYRFNVDYDLRSPHHDVKAGGIYDLTTIGKNYAVSLQPNNPISVAPTTIVDNAPNTGHTQEAYLQDTWRMGTTYQLDYGLRADAFQLASTQFRSGSFALSPRVKLTRFIGSRASVYAYYGRFFTPYSFENVSPATARALNPASGDFDLLPQRDSVYEAGGHLPVAGGDLGLRVMQKDATDVVDDTQVGTTNLHQDINYKLGRVATQTAFFQRSLTRSGRVYVSATHTYSVVRHCETQLLAPCFNGPANDWTPADHDQRVDFNGGILLNDTRGGWLAFNGEYGSGLTSAGCQPVSDNCKSPPHTTFDFQKGMGVANGGALTLTIHNLFNDRYRVTYLNAQGNHYARPRSVEVGFRVSGR